MPNLTRRASLLALALALAAPALAQLKPPRDTKEAVKHYRAGKDALARERWAEAEEEFRRAADLDPLLVGAHYGLGQTMMATKSYAEAVRAFEAARDAFAQSQAVSAEDEALAQRRIDDQIRALQDDIASASRSGGSTGPSVQAAIDRNQEQIKTLQGLRNRGGSEPLPTPHWLSFALGSAYFRNRDLQKAEAEYRAALAQKPDLGEGHLNLAVVCMLTGRLDEAGSEVALAEKAGVRVPQGLKDDIAKRRQAAPPQP
jgi:tetratricopeptide (TPR) repeat protein